MITKTRARKSDLFEFFGLDKSPKSSNINKQKLIQMAKNKEPRPSHETKLGQALSSYMNKSSSSYCEEFKKTIMKEAPFWSRIEIANQKKQKLIQMAENGEPRPSQKTKEGKSLTGYTSKSSGSYCEEFDKLIRVKAPSWFVYRTQIANYMRQKLIQMAENGKPRPSRKTKEGSALSRYTSKSSSSYCEEFDKSIRVKAPSWFLSQTQIANCMRQKLIQMAENGNPRPSQKTKEGRAVTSYTNKHSSSYCKEFDKIIRVKAPFWFRKKPTLVK